MKRLRHRNEREVEEEEENEAPTRRSKQKKSNHTGSHQESSGDANVEQDSAQVGQSNRENDADDGEPEEDVGGVLDFTQVDYTMHSATQDNGTQVGEAKSPSVPVKIGQLSAKAIDDLKAQLVRYMLYKAGLRLPIKFGDISKEVFPKHKNVSRYFFQRAKQQLENVFGYQVVRVEDNSTKELYIVINSPFSEKHQLQVNKGDRCASRGLLMMILGLLWCAPGRQLSECDLFKQLAQVDSSIKQGKDHRHLGDVLQLIKTFESQLYLNGTSELDADLKKVKFYSYGSRALLEVGKVHILNFVCKLITGRPPPEVQINEVNLETQPVLT